MSVAGAVALAVAERVERTGGTRAGLVAWRALAGNASDAETRAKALIAGVRCATLLRDTTVLEELIALWATIDRGDWPVSGLCRDLARAQLIPQAVDLAQVEATRNRTAHALYTYARCLEVAHDVTTAEWLDRTIERATKEGNARISEAARLRKMALLARSWTTIGHALAEAELLQHVAPASRMDVARVLLFSGSRFVRAGAIGLLAEVAQNDDVELRQRARRLAARYADEAGEAVTPLEQDRLVALFDHDAKAAIKGAVSPAMEPVVARARDVLRGRYEVPPIDLPAVPDEPRARRVVRHGEILDVVVAMRDGAPARAARSLRPLAHAIESGERLPREGIAVAVHALGFGNEELANVALRIVKAWLGRPSYIVPPRGFLALADMLADADLAMIARRAAVLRRENGALQALATILVRVGWEAARGDDRPHAIRLLREAKTLILKG